MIINSSVTLVEWFYRKVVANLICFSCMSLFLGMVQILVSYEVVRMVSLEAGEEFMVKMSLLI